MTKSMQLTQARLRLGRFLNEDAWTHEEACMLLLGHDPDIPYEESEDGQKTQDLIEEYESLMESLGRAVIAGKVKQFAKGDCNYIKPESFMVWAYKKRYKGAREYLKVMANGAHVSSSPKLKKSAARSVSKKKSIRATPKGSTGTGPVVQTPSGTTWRDVKISFVDGDTVNVKIKGGSPTKYTYYDMGFSKRNKKPNMMWVILKVFANAETPGELPKNFVDSKDLSKTKKQIQLLRKHLERMFGISGNPIELDARYRVWTTNFKIRPEAPEHPHEQRM